MKTERLDTGENILDYSKIMPTACLCKNRILGSYPQNILEHTAAKVPGISTRSQWRQNTEVTERNLKACTHVLTHAALRQLDV